MESGSVMKVKVFLFFVFLSPGPRTVPGTVQTQRVYLLTERGEEVPLPGHMSATTAAIGLANRHSAFP